jgi:hypothetical protein
MAAMAAITFALGAGAGWSLRDVGADRYAASVETERAVERAQAQKKYDESVAAAAALARALEAEKAKAENVRIIERVRTVRVADAADADLDRLRDDIAHYAVGLAAAEDSVAAARGRAEALGRLLEASLSAGAACARDAENLATDVRALRAAWPVAPPGA